MFFSLLSRGLEGNPLRGMAALSLLHFLLTEIPYGEFCVQVTLWQEKIATGTQNHKVLQLYYPTLAFKSWNSTENNKYNILI